MLILINKFKYRGGGGGVLIIIMRSDGRTQQKLRAEQAKQKVNFRRGKIPYKISYFL